MVKLLAAFSPVLLAATVAGGAVDSQTSTPAQQRVTATGCIVRNGTTDINKGVRQLNIPRGALALTEARISGSGAPRVSAVPGSVPEGTNSGTIPQQTIAGTQATTSETATFALEGSAAGKLGDYVGKRVEIVGQIAAARTSSTPQPQGTAGSTEPNRSEAGSANGRPAAQDTAHPSAELQRLQVVSFRSAPGTCN